MKLRDILSSLSLGHWIVTSIFSIIPAMMALLYWIDTLSPWLQWWAKFGIGMTASTIITLIVLWSHKKWQQYKWRKWVDRKHSD